MDVLYDFLRRGARSCKAARARARAAVRKRDTPGSGRFISVVPDVDFLGIEQYALTLHDGAGHDRGGPRIGVADIHLLVVEQPGLALHHRTDVHVALAAAGGVAYVHVLVVEQSRLALVHVVDRDVRLPALVRIADGHILLVQQPDLPLVHVLRIDFRLAAALRVPQ